MKHPFVSIVIPTYNRAGKLRETLESLTSQSYPKNRYEVIVVDDGSTDRTEDAVGGFKRGFRNLRYLRQRNRGPAAARNFGIKEGRGGIIAFTDDDCIVPKDWVDELVAAYERNPEVAGVGGYLEASAELLKRNIFAQYESYEARVVYGLGDEELIGGENVPGMGTANVSFKKKILEEVGGFDDFFRTAAGEDMDLKKRIAERGYKFVYIPLKVTHIQNYDFNRFLKQSWVRGVGSKYFDRKYGRRTALESLAKILFWPAILVYLILESPLDARHVKMSAVRVVRMFVSSVARLIGG